MKNPLLYDKFIRCECRLPPLLSLPLNRIPTYTYPRPPAPFWTLFFLWGGLCLPVHTRKTQYKTVHAYRSEVGTRHRTQSTHSYPPRGSFPCVNTKFSRHWKQSDLLKVGKETSGRRTTFQVTLTDETRCDSESKINYSLNVVRKFQIKCCP